MRPAIFMDRDGVICKEQNLFFKGFPITKPEHFEWIPKSREALGILARTYVPLIVITNQSVINKGLLNVEEFFKINGPIYKLLERNESKPYIFFCPHTKSDNCNCRKPKTGLIMEAQKEFEIDILKSYVIGDKTSDIKMGENAGCKTILVQTGYGGKDSQYTIKPDFVVDDLYDAVIEIILK